MFFSQLDFNSLRITVGPIKLKPFLSPGQVREGGTSTSLYYEDCVQGTKEPGKLGKAMLPGSTWAIQKPSVASLLP